MVSEAGSDATLTSHPGHIAMREHDDPTFDWFWEDAPPSGEAAHALPHHGLVAPAICEEYDHDDHHDDARTAPPRSSRLGEVIEAEQLPYLATSTSLHIALLAIILTTPIGFDSLTQLTAPRDAEPIVHIVMFSPPPLLLDAPAPPPPLDAHAHDLQGDGVDDALGAQHAGAEGQAGTPPTTAHDTPPLTPGRMSVRRRDDTKTSPPHALASAQAPKTLEMAQVGALGALAATRADLLGSASRTQGDDTLDKLGAVREGRRDAAHGTLGLGLSGAGRGGGATQPSESVGIGQDLGLQRIALGGRGAAPRLEDRGHDQRDLLITPTPHTSLQIDGARCLSADMIKRSIQLRKNQLRTCYEDALLTQRQLTAQMTLQLTILPNGSLERVAFTQHTPHTEHLARCIQQRLADLRFPAFTTCEHVIVSYPLSFSQRPESEPLRQTRR